MPTYTNVQKEELSTLFARSLHASLMREKTCTITDLTLMLAAELSKLEWFTRIEAEKLLKHLEEEGVYGVYYFYPDKRPTLYLHTVFSRKFAQWTVQTRPSVEKFLAAFPKASPRKPSEEEMKGTEAGLSPRPKRGRGIIVNKALPR